MIEFYRTEKNNCPVESFFDSLSDREVEKILWILKLIRELDRIPKQYFKKIVSTENIWEVRVQFGKRIFRLLGFMHVSNIIILTNGFAKKSQKTPNQEIKLAEKRKRDYIARS